VDHFHSSIFMSLCRAQNQIKLLQDFKTDIFKKQDSHLLKNDQLLSSNAQKTKTWWTKMMDGKKEESGIILDDIG